MARQQKLHRLSGALLCNPDVTRMATFASAAFRAWAPRLYAHYLDHNSKLAKAFPHLRRPFPKSVFSCAAFNFGTNVWTFKHRDVCNLPFGWGHLVLWDLKLVVEFPAGALILLPSATIAHSNIPVQEAMSAISFTQFTAGGLFRFVDAGLRNASRAGGRRSRGVRAIEGEARVPVGGGA
ncbi:hypothetical protein B0H14DRAFT_3098397 [Mycena olivaceomarginata]|nr:hypothetical protein B0H14DRAFT_3098397 [Mycena olivaceomarginata]